MTPSRARLATAGITLAALALAAWRVNQLAGRFLVMDDAFISFRYARHLAEGHGLVFNLGERVEGYSNFLWTVLIAAGFHLGLEPTTVTLGLSWCALAATLYLLARLAVQLVGLASPVATSLAAAPALAYALGDRARFLVSGMEMLLFAALTFGAFAAVIWPGRELTPRRGAACGVLFALAAWTHPEGALYAGLTGLMLLLAGPRAAWRQRLAPTAAFAAGFALLFVPYFAWRWWYFGELLPNTAHAKLGGTPFDRLLVGWDLLPGLLWATGWCAWLALAGLALWRVREPFVRRAGGALVVLLGYFLWAGGDYLLLFADRFLLPALPLVLLLGVVGLRPLVMGGPVARGAAFALAFVAVLASGLRPWPAALEPLEWIETHHRGLRAAADWVTRETRPDAVIAAGTMGILPYYAERRYIDVFGLTDPFIARQPPDFSQPPAHQKAAPRYVLDQQPDFVISHGALGRGLPQHGKLDLLAPRFLREYHLRAMVKSHFGPLPNRPWVVETEVFRPDLYVLGYRMVIWQRRVEVAPPGLGESR